MRFALPGLNNLWQVALKDSSLISVTGLAELMRVSPRSPPARRASPSPSISPAARFICVLTVFSNRVFEFAEARAARSRRRAEA